MTTTDNRRSSRRDLANPPTVRPVERARTGRVAFFAVDETLVSAQSTESFILFSRRLRDGHDRACRAAIDVIHAESARGVQRRELVRMHAQLLAGESPERLREIAMQWWAHCRHTVIEATAAAVASHRAAGDAVVLLSGSLRVCLDPIADDLGADLVICSDPAVDDFGRLTGEVVRPMVGPAKAEAAVRAAASLGADTARCVAYASRSGDLDLLRAVGHPVVVGTHPVLAAEAARRGWPTLSEGSAAVPARAA